MMTAKEILQALKDRYPDPEDDQVSIQFSGYVHEHPMTAIEVVLISSIVLGTTEVNKLAEFTGYSKRFIGSIASNMENNRLWEDGTYKYEGWSSGNLLPRNQHEESEFLDHVSIAEGTCWTQDAKSADSVDPCAIFWNEKRVGCSRGRGRAWRARHRAVFGGPGAAP